MAPERELRRDAQTFVLGAACGLLAGVLALSAVLWQYGNGIGSEVSGQMPPGGPAAAGAPRFDDSPGVSGGPTLPAPSPEAVISAPAESAAELAERGLSVPVDGVTPDQLTRSFDDRRGGERSHQAIDILAPRHTPVRAVDDGTIARLFDSRAGGITIYQFDPTEQYCYYYAHLERYADGLIEGQRVQKGQVIGYVGTSGNAPADTPHLHFAVFRLTSAKRWWEGTPIDPYDLLGR